MLEKETNPGELILDREALDPNIKEIIVAAASRFKVNGKIIVVCDAMHWGQNIQSLFLGLFEGAGIAWEQVDDGFINNVGDFKTREQAMLIVKASGQPFSIEENMGDLVLFSEGIRRHSTDKNWSELTSNYAGK